jgi:probable rRNA maturation factor
MKSPSVFIDNRVGRKGIPTRRSFEAWIGVALGARARRTVNVALLPENDARELNRRFRRKDYATNVLSFRFEPIGGEKNTSLGDLALCPAVVAREAKEQGKPIRDHFAHLTIHGVLHLLGYDHENRKDAQKMEALEVRLLAKLGIPDPY